MKTKTGGLREWIDHNASPFESIEKADLSPMLERIGDAQVVLIGEASHGTSEFYRMRQRITAELIREKGFQMIGIEGDWPDVEHVDSYVRARESRKMRSREAFSRFPTWMWRNAEVREFVEWLRRHNADQKDSARKVAMYGLDLYSMYTSIHEVIEYLDRKDNPSMAQIARERYSGLLAYEPEAEAYGQAVAFLSEKGQEDKVVAMLCDLLERRFEAGASELEAAFDAEQNARIVASAENYYRSTYLGTRSGWNIRDGHMFETLKHLTKLHDRNGKMIVWAHNSHIGDARHTEMGQRGEYNIGQLCNETFGERSYRIGFGTHSGTVAAADNWGQEVKIKKVNPSVVGSHEHDCHESGYRQFFLSLREARDARVPFDRKLERAIGVIYRPGTELLSHYFEADLEHQFDEYIWFDQTKAVSPLSRETAPDLPAEHPFLIVD